MTVLRGLSLAVDAGEMVAIVGASGVGKSTLLHVLGGLDSIDGGSMRIGDADLREMRARPARRVPQPPRRVRVSVSSSVAGVQRPREHGHAACGLPARRRTSATGARTALLERVGLGERLAHRPGMLSGGEQQRVAIARALIMDPTILLADEPTGDLDEHTAESLHNLLREMHRERGLTSIIATHNPRLAAACDRVLRLEEGQLRPVSSPS